MHIHSKPQSTGLILTAQPGEATGIHARLRARLPTRVITSHRVQTKEVMLRKAAKVGLSAADRTAR